ncbi:MAG: hypothetical protein EP299_10550 [Acidobacteria bacterium]|nr:MAG: hypothetical protein EP299_10550 [Acidobacteriota bacterium]
MQHLVRWSCFLLVVSILAGGLVACSPKSPEEKVAQTRSLYKARLNGFIVREEPVGGVEEFVETEISAEEPADEVIEEVTEEEIREELEPVPVVQKVLLDILIQHDSPEKLPGLTVDISMVDAQGNDKGHWRVWFDTANIVKATPTQFTHVLEDIGYVEGDGFFVEVRQPIPASEYGDYKEFSS